MTVIPYELIVTSATRPHLLKPTLESLFAHVDQESERLLIHDDAVFKGRDLAMQEAIAGAIPPNVGVVLKRDKPPIGLGPALHWLLSQVRTEYVLYSQDDHVVVRPLPIRAALDVMRAHDLHHVRFNKRDTMDKKGDWQKVERRYGDVTLTVSDHWYFQTSLWRVAPIRDVVAWWALLGPGNFGEHAEAKVNHVFNGGWTRPHTRYRWAFDGPAAVISDPARWNDQALRAEILRTFIWGGIGEPQYVRHIGDAPEDWALIRNRV